MSGEKPFLSTAENTLEIAKDQKTPKEVYLDLLKQFHICADASRKKNQEDNQEDEEKPDATLFLDLSNSSSDDKIRLETSLLKSIHDDFMNQCFGYSHHKSKSNRVFEMYSYDNSKQVGKLNDGEVPGTFVDVEQLEDAHILVTLAFSDGKYSTPDKEFLVRQYYADSEGNITDIAD